MLQGRKNRQMQQKSIKENSILNVIKTLSGIIFPLITFPYISRVLGPGNVGKVNFGSTYVSYFSLLASLGISSYAIRECSSVRYDEKELSRKASEIYSINICMTLISYILLFCSLLLFRELDKYSYLIILQSSVILFTTLGADWINSAMEDFRYITYRTIGFQILALLMMFVFVHKNSDYYKYAITSVIASSGANIVNMIYRRRYCSIHFTLKMKLKQHMYHILMLFVMLLAQTIYGSSDTTMLGLMRTDYDVGIYSTAYKVKNIIAQVVVSLAWVVMPRMSLYFSKNDYEKINKMLKKCLGVMVLIGFPCIAGCMVLSPEIVQIVGGCEFRDASVPLVIMMFSFIFDLFGASFLGNMICLPARKEKYFMQACCISAIVNVILNFIFIPYGGVNAAACSTVISYFIIFIWLLKNRDKKIKLDYFFDVCKIPFIGSIVMSLFCIVIKNLIKGIFNITIVSVIGGAIIYFFIQLKMKNFIFMEFYKNIISKLYILRKNGHK